MEKEIYSIKLKNDESKVVLSYLKGTQLQVEDFVKKIYGPIEVIIYPLTKNGKFRFPWGLSHPVIDLEPIYTVKPIDKNDYLVRIDGDFFIGKMYEIEKYPSIISKVYVKLKSNEFIKLLEKTKDCNRISEHWLKISKDSKSYKKFKKFWNKKLRVK